MKVNLLDFDKTIYDGDSSVDFYLYLLKKKPIIIIYVPKFIIYYFFYKIRLMSKDKAKEQIFRFVTKFEDIDRELEDFWKIKKYKIKDFYKNKDHSSDIIISASPYFLLKPIGDELGVMNLIASPVDKHTGKYNGKNCYGEEKVRRLKEIYSNIEVIEAYSDSLSDLPMLNLAKKRYLVKGNKIVKYK